jgi:mono/diheme cytochrome c family protein
MPTSTEPMKWMNAVRAAGLRLAWGLGAGLAVAFVVTSLQALSAGPAAAAESPDADASELFAESGRALYVRYCSACHGSAGRGDGPVAAELRTTPADLTRIAARNDGVFPAAEVARTIDGRDDVRAHGTREMPVWGRRFGKDLDESAAEEVVRGNISVLVDYLRSIQVSQGSPKD